MSAALREPPCTVRLKRPHPQQLHFLRSKAPRRVVRAGRRSGKTTGMAILAVEEFLKGERVLYAVPTTDQIQRFWHEVCLFLAEPIDAGLYRKNETLHVIEREGTEQRIRAKTAWNADTLRGDYCSLLILDEWQLCAESAWEIVGAPMLLDRNGRAVFCYTPPSYRTAGVTKAEDPRHAAKLYKAARADTSGRWAAFHFTSHDNPYLSQVALEQIGEDMSALAYRQEILAEDVEDPPGALWKRADIERARVREHPPLRRIVVGVDPHASTGATGIVVAGIGQDKQGYILDDLTTGGSPATWAGQVVTAYHKHQADRIIAEANNGGDMVIATIETVDKRVSTKKVWASRGKQTRAEPVSALYEKGLVHHVGLFGSLEDELCSWVPGETAESPNRLDALVWALTELMLEGKERPLVLPGGPTGSSYWRA